MNGKMRIGIFGGTFDPPHFGHIHAALTFINSMDLDYLYVIPASIPPHKTIKGCPDPSIRLEMTNAAFSGLDDKIKISDYEIKKGCISYTVDTLDFFSAPDSDLFLLCGSDMFFSLPLWRSPERIFSLASVVVISRNNGEYGLLKQRAKEYEESFGASCFVLDSIPYVISSTDIRKMISSDNYDDSALPSEVLRIIEREKLYK